MIGIPFLFNPNKIPFSSACKNWEVKGKKADNAFVVMLRLIFNWSTPKGMVESIP